MLSLVLALVAVISLICINEIGFQRSSTALSGITQSVHGRAALHRLLRHVFGAETGWRATGNAAVGGLLQAGDRDADKDTRRTLIRDR